MIQNAETSYAESVGNAEAIKEKNIAKAEEKLEEVFRDYIKPEIEYGHFSVTIDDYVVKLNLRDAGVRTVFFDKLKELGYVTNTVNIAISNTRIEDTGQLMIDWNKDTRHCINDFGTK